MSKKLNLAEMAQGAFVERFHMELDKALANIADPNTDPKKARKIVLTATLKADEDRDIVNFEVQSQAKLVPAMPVNTKVILDKDVDGSVVAAELISGIKGQTFLDADGSVKDDKGNVVSFNNKERGIVND